MFCFFVLLVHRSLSIKRHSLVLVSRLDHLFVCLCVLKVYCGKTAEWIRRLFVMVSGVGRGMSVLDRGGYNQREWAVLG